MRGFLIGLISLVVTTSWAQEALGPTYPIIEPDMLEMMQKHAQENQQETRNRIKAQQQTLQAWRDAPKGLTLPPTQVESVKHYPVDLPEGILADDFYRAWLMIDATVEGHLTLAHAFIEENPANHRVVLVNGNVKASEETLKTRIWFDQK